MALRWQEVTEDLEVSANGQFRSGDKTLTIFKRPNGSEYVKFRGRTYTCAVEVARAYVNNPKGYSFVKIVNPDVGIKPSNLRWVKSHAKKIDGEIAKQMRKDVKSGASQKDVAKKYGVSASATSRIINNKRWN